MWRSKTRAFILRSLYSHHHLQTHTSYGHRLTQTLTKPLRPPPSHSFPNPRFFSSLDATDPSSESTDLKLDEPFDEPIENSAWNFNETEDSINEFGVDENLHSDEASSWNFEENGESKIGFEENGESKIGFEEDGENKIINEEEVKEGEEVEKVEELDLEKVENVVAILKNDSFEEPIEVSLENLGLNLSEEFVIKVIEGSDNVGINLIEFYNWVLKKDESLKTMKALELILHSVKSLSEVSKKDAYKLWDLIKELGKDAGFLRMDILNEMIAMFWKLGKAKAGLEVYEKFGEFGCEHDASSYYYTILALGKRSMHDKAWEVCKEMISSGSLSEKEKIGEIVSFFCKGGKAKEAHLVYLVAKEKNLELPRYSLDFLICGLTRYDEHIPLALELLEDYPEGAGKHANRTYGLVIKGLCKIKKHEEAKKLLLKMVEAGPSPGNASFNNVINALSKNGEVDDAVSLMKVMESRGLRPDVYTYTVVMSGYARGGLMNEAYKIYCEAKKRHAMLSPATYHVLTRGYCKMEEFEKAVEIIKEMKEHRVKPNADEYNKMIETLCLKALDWRTAEKLLEEMKESGLYLKGVTHSLVAAVRELEEEETQPEAVNIEA